MKVILHNKDTLKLDFAYNRSTIERIKMLPSRKYNPSGQYWTIPVADSMESLKKLRVLGFVVDEAVYKRAIEHDDDIAVSSEYKQKTDDVSFESPLPLLPYQRVGAGFITKIGGSGLIADEVGLGKTIQSLAVAEHLGVKKVLIFCPAVLKYQWESEIKKFMGKDTFVSVIDGDKEWRKACWEFDARFYVANYELLLHDDIVKVIEESFTMDSMIIADEATRISNIKTKTHKALQRVSNLSQIEYKVALTGTPISNKVDEIFGIVDWIKPGMLGNFTWFTGRYCVKDYWGSIVESQNIEELNRKLQGVMIRREKKEVLKELPDKIITDVPFELSKKERKLYDQIREELLFEIEQMDIDKLNNPTTIQMTLVKFLRLQQLTDSMELLGDNTDSSKLDVLRELLKENIVSDRKAIIFTKFSKMADILKRELEDYKPLMITGKVPNKDRAEIVERFNTLQDNKILIMTNAGIYGLNIQSASVIIHFDLPWSLAQVVQREGRAHRMGQEHKVMIYNLIARKTIDEYVLKIIRKKQGLSEELLEEKKITANDLFDILNE